MKYMSAIQLPGPFANPQHMRGQAIIEFLDLLGQGCLVRQDEALVRGEKAIHVIADEIMSNDGV